MVATAGTIKGIDMLKCMSKYFSLFGCKSNDSGSGVDLFRSKKKLQMPD